MKASRLLTHPAALTPLRYGLRVGSIQAWPAAGGGLLVGVAEPAFAGSVLLRHKGETLFLRIGDQERATAMLPYARLEDEVCGCIRALIAAELHLSDSCVEIHAQSIGPGGVADLGSSAELSLQVSAAVARMLLVTAAAEDWGVSPSQYIAVDGTIRGPLDSIRYGGIAAAAALCDLPGAVRLVSGREVSLVPSMFDRRDHFACADQVQCMIDRQRSIPTDKGAET